MRKTITLMVFMVCMIILSLVSVYGATSDSAIIELSLLNQDPNPARAGDTVSLRFKLENTGGQAVTNMDVELNPGLSIYNC